MKVDFKVLGLQEMDAALAEFKKSTARGVANRALLKAAAPVVEEARRLVPVRLGDLRDSIIATTLKPVGHASKAAYAATMRAGGTKAEAAAAQRAYNRENPGAFAEVFIAPGRLAQAWPQEIGTENHPPHPYIRPAIANKAKESMEILAVELRSEISKTAERARSRALKKAAKG